ncbi:MAG: chorismate-binding protein [Phycisphaerales bacterium]|nr:chorismate-binding protein [Phycisphaerales bacterium]
MNRYFARFLVGDIDKFKIQSLIWSKSYSPVALLDTNSKTYREDEYIFLFAIGAVSVCTSDRKEDNSVFNAYLQQYVTETKDWIFGNLSFEFYAYTEDLIFNDPQEEPMSKVGKPSACFLFRPDIIIKAIDSHCIFISSLTRNCDEVFSLISSIDIPDFNACFIQDSLLFTPYLSKLEYCNRINKLKEHIQQGDCYEINYCQGFFAKIENSIDLESIYAVLGKSIKMPMACFYKYNNHYLLSMSPERFIKKKGSCLLSQPIKGTYRKTGQSNDVGMEKKMFSLNKKEITENIMIVDLVRNDFSKVCIPSSVKVSECCAIYSFKNLYHMISTVVGSLYPDKDWFSCMQACFPMGSMTGVPKKRVLELTHQFEARDRGLYSGSVFYITPEGDFDSNVIIRSLFYNTIESALAVWTGGAITKSSDAESEYNECRLKIDALLSAIGAHVHAI